ncbi:Gfo/Idh/MocA family protein [Marinobacterium sp. LSUCC0821]|uniref:Gfo/Idh/MocA family protein n=1 Tax=Marinobacterium sp. LSUCC0821 TaxID=2668067 RepID=UPI001451B627|nr:Gfo/Idh/MocA family oxidoreductase [Marinobacterium sp. LSUCC0821]QJD72160.1 Gfo/Idh/MocA family oxidoreductase [Marinobacterium sp. LSUCC0821]
MGYDIDLDPKQHIYSHARAFTLHSEYVLVGGVDPDPGMRAAFSRSYGVLAYETAEAALVEQAPELVVIAVPTSLHGLTLETVLKFSSVKVVLCEKPLSYDLAESQCMARACQKRGVQLVVNYMRRSDPAVIEIGRRFVSGEIQGPVKGLVWYGGGLIHNGSHFFNLLRYWLGEMIDFQILGSAKPLGNDDAEVDVSIQFEGGKVLFLSTMDRDFAHYEVELMADNGRLRYERAGHRVTWQGLEQHPVFSKSKSIANETELIESGMNKFQYNVASQVEELFAGRVSHVATGEDAVSTLEALTRIIGKI